MQMKNKSISIITNPPPPPSVELAPKLPYFAATARPLQTECFTAHKEEIHAALSSKLGRVMVAFF